MRLGGIPACVTPSVGRSLHGAAGPSGRPQQAAFMGQCPPLPGRGFRLSVALRRVPALAPRPHRPEPGTAFAVDVQGRWQGGGDGPRIAQRSQRSAPLLALEARLRFQAVAGFAFVGQTLRHDCNCVTAEPQEPARFFRSKAPRLPRLRATSPPSDPLRSQRRGTNCDPPGMP